MSDSTVAPALDVLPVADSVCLEAGAGAGNTSAAILKRDPAVVYAVTDDPSHAATVRDRFESEPRLRPLRADLRATPLPAASVDIVTAHALMNVLTPAAVSAIAGELTRVTRDDGYLVIVDYEPVPDDRVRELFAVENAVAELTTAQPALVFYPPALLRRVFTTAGWRLLETGTTLQPVPWTEELLDAHLELIEDHLAELPAPLADALGAYAHQVRGRIDGGVETGAMYYHVFECATA